jgi:hypothetical protein
MQALQFRSFLRLEIAVWAKASKGKHTQRKLTAKMRAEFG